MADPSRLYAGFSDLSGGMDGGQAASLIGLNQSALLINATVRGSYVSTRPPFTMPTLYDKSQVLSRWTGIFQGSMFYDGENGTSGWIISRGGNLFFLPADTRVLQEITPKLDISTTLGFTVPAPAASVNIFVNSAVPFTTGDTIKIDSGTYVITNIFTDEISATYTGGAANATAVAGNAVLDGAGAQISEWQSNPDTYDFIFMFQAENYGIILGGQHPTIIFDGRKARRAGINEIPPGLLGAYGWGRIWICAADRRTFVAGNLCFDPSGGGTAANRFRDSILKFTDNDIINEGGTFGVPIGSGPITTMQFLATQDTSLGVGVLLVTTTNMVFSVNAPVDRAQWKNLTYPIQTVSLIDYGPESPRGSVSVNGDMWYRSTDGFRSFLVARRNFDMPGNTPLSHEIGPVIENDTQDLLFYGSGIVFDNRLLETVSPFRTAFGVAHRGLAVVNFDLVSELRQKRPACWEGAWTGLDILQTLKGRIANVERAFIWAIGQDDIELWEIESQGTADVALSTRVPIQSVITTRSHDYGDVRIFKSLRMGEFWIDEITDNVTIKVSFRPDQYPTWTLWSTLNFCATVSQCTFTSTLGGVCKTWTANAKSYAAGISIPQPPETCNDIAHTPIRYGHLFQFKLEITGSCRIRAFVSHINVRTSPTEGECPGEVQCVLFGDCGEAIFGLYDSHGP